MKVLTICEPFATLIARQEKRVENRTWPTSYRGPLLIHAGKSRQWLDLSDDGSRDVQYDIPLAEMPFGCVVAVARLSGCVAPFSGYSKKFVDAWLETWPWLLDHEHTEGPWCWVLENVQRLPEPIPAKGAQGLWVPSSELVTKVNEQLAVTV